MQKVFLLKTDILHNQDIFQREYEKMPEYRKEKIDHVHSIKDKILSLGAGILLQKGLRAAGIEEKQTKIAFGENGKPYLADYENFFFSLSHSGDYAMASFADTQTGCDIELIKKANMKVARRFYSADELHTLEKEMDEQKQTELFYRLWTLKESYIKLTGQGMALALDSFTIHLSDFVTIAVDGEPQNVLFEEFEIDHYRAAVCTRVNSVQDNRQMESNLIRVVV